MDEQQPGYYESTESPFRAQQESRLFEPSPGMRSSPYQRTSATVSHMQNQSVGDVEPQPLGLV